MLVELGQEQADRLPNRAVVVDASAQVWQLQGSRWVPVRETIDEANRWPDPAWPVRLLVLADVPTTERVLEAVETAQNVVGGWFG